MRPIFIPSAILVALISYVTALSAQSATTRALSAGTTFDTTLAASGVHRYAMVLRRGQSANVVVTQMGVDVVIEVRSPDGNVIGSFDSPNGRDGDEPVEIMASAGGIYVLSVQPIDEREPQGRYRLRVIALRDEAATTAMLDTRRAAREAATAWLRMRSVAIPANGKLSFAGDYPALDRLARRVRVLGVGESTHGSKEFTDFRLALTRRLVERFGYRMIAIEASTDKLAQLEQIAAGKRAGNVADLAREAGWIGERARVELTRWLATWNAAHPNDHAHIVGVDPQITQAPQRWFSQFLVRAYGPDLVTRWAPVARELAAADSQVLVFGNSNVNAQTRGALFEMLTRLELDAPLLRVRFGSTSVDSARAYVRQFVEFADFNAGDDSTIVRAHNRDWYMATRVLSALSAAGPQGKVVYWAHNAHVHAPPGRPAGARPSGAELRDALGCGYGALGLSFGEGGFLSQIPNDAEDRLHLSSLPLAPDESIDAVLGGIRPGGSAVTWECGRRAAMEPAWLQQSHPMHWVGALFAPGTMAASAFRAFDILRDFDGLAYFPRVTAEPLPPKRAVVPARAP
ncbi:MAG: hypothetical protein JWL61_2253 [Gemmatimonadetes bacterium]|nr:hypothetical protein [Gemmatimonadota bacterium]